MDKGFFFKSQCELNKEPIWQYCGFKNFVRLQLNKYETTSLMVLEKKRLGVQPQNGIPGFILHFPLEPSYGYLRFEGNGKIPLGR